MLSYQHIYHAGNHADVIKHLSVLSLLDFYAKKSKPATFIDTHAGAGHYSLSSPELQKNNEYLDGIASLLSLEQQITNPLLSRFVKQAQVNAQNNYYAGSIALLHDALREQDQLHGIELHPQAFAHLERVINKPNAHIYCEDSFAQLNALTPPLYKRGLVLIDPPYEDLFEYDAVVNAVSSAMNKWSTACFAIWYPLLSARAGVKSGQSQQMVQSLAELPVKNAWKIELSIADIQADVGMYGSGMLLLNCPYQVDNQIEKATNELADIWHAQFASEWLIQPD